MKEYKFPDGFLWGSSTSSYQVEGGIENNDWASYCRDCHRVERHSGARPRVPCAGKAADHYNRYAEDFDIAKSLGQNAHRFSIEWARIEPKEGEFSEEAIEHYKKVIDALRQRGIKPFVTLWHFTLPLWFSKIGGFTNKKAPFYFSRYCEYVVRRMGENVDFWITMNEPMVYAWAGYGKGVWPPFIKNLYGFWKVIKTLISSHLASHNIIKKINPGARVGIAKNNIYFKNWLILILNYFWNFYFLNKIKNNLDFVGLNYYFHWRFLGNENKETSDMGWEIYPEGIYHTLRDLKRYHLPVYVTENGLADAKDTKRARFIKNHLRWSWQAMHDGVDLRGYFYWSLLDNFEWAHGFEPRFGLVEINYATLERKIRPSAYEYAGICKTNVL